MLEPTIILSWTLVLIMILILSSLWIFREKLKEWDARLRQSLFNNERSQQGWGAYYPSAFYKTAKLSAEGHILSQVELSCSGENMAQALDGLTYLLGLSKKEGQDAEDKKGRKI